MTLTPRVTRDQETTPLISSRLFEPTNHSFVSIPWTSFQESSLFQKNPDLGNDTLAQLASVARALGGSEGYENVRFVDNYYARSNSLSLLLTLADGSEVLCKRHLRFVNPATLPMLGDLTAFLADDGALVPRMRTFQNGGYVFQNGAATWSAWEPLPFSNYFGGSPSEQRLAAFAIGTVAGSLRRVPAALKTAIAGQVPGCEFGPFGEKDLLSLHAIAREKHSGSSDFILFDSALPDLVQAIAIRDQLMHGRTPLPTENQLIHYDYHPFNIPRLGDRFYVVDFKGIRIGNIYTDLGFASIALIRQGASRHGFSGVDQSISEFWRGLSESGLQVDLDRNLIFAYGLDRVLTHLGSILDRRFVQDRPEMVDTISKFLLFPSEALVLYDSRARSAYCDGLQSLDFTFPRPGSTPG